MTAEEKEKKTDTEQLHQISIAYLLEEGGYSDLFRRCLYVIASILLALILSRS